MVINATTKAIEYLSYNVLFRALNNTSFKYSMLSECNVTRNE